MIVPITALEPPKIPSISNVIKQPKPKVEPPKEYIVKEGDTLTSIANAHSSSVGRLWSKNTTLSSPDVIEPGKPLIIPENTEILAERPLPAIVEVVTNQTAIQRPTLIRSGGVSSSGNSYAFGNCTFGVKNWRPDIPNTWGDAVNWLANAQRDGWATGSEPRVGAVAWARNYGHVAYVIATDGQSVTVREENYQGFNVVSTRVSDKSEWMFIY